MKNSEWAKNEVKIACDGDFANICYKSALKAYLSLCEDQHSGTTFGITRNILLRLLYARPLTAIEGKEDDWKLACGIEDGEKIYQCNRMPSLFKHMLPDGTIEYHANNYYCVDEVSGNTYFGGGAGAVLEQYIEPITMPYYPPTRDYVIHIREYLSDSKNGDFDTIVYLYIVCPDGKRIEVNKAYADTGCGWKEISEEELTKRIRMHEEREKQ